MARGATTSRVLRTALGVLLLGVLAVAGFIAATRFGGDRAPALASVDVAPPAVDGCLPAEGTVTLDADASGGETVDLAASSPVVEVPDHVAVPAGARDASFPVRTRPVPAPQQVEVRATLRGTTVTGPVELRPVGAATLVAHPTPECDAGFTEHHGYGDPQRSGVFDADRVGEASGLVASRRNPGWLYLLDDEAPREVWAVRTDGTEMHAIPLEGFVGRDTESLAVGPCADRSEPCVYVGDIGDNLGTHPDVAIVRFPEPALPATGPAGDPAAPVAAETIRVTYPDGPVDAEALLVDEAGGLYIVTNEAAEDGTSGARLFTAPAFVDGVLTALGPVPVPEPRLPLAAAFLGVLVTGGDHRDGRVLLRTYDSVVEYVAPAPDAPLAQFGSWPARELPAAREPQSEAVAYAPDGCGYYSVGEMVGDLWFVRCLR